MDDPGDLSDPVVLTGVLTFTTALLSFITCAILLLCYLLRSVTFYLSSIGLDRIVGMDIFSFLELEAKCLSNIFLCCMQPVGQGYSFHFCTYEFVLSSSRMGYMPPKYSFFCMYITISLLFYDMLRNETSRIFLLLI